MPEPSLFQRLKERKLVQWAVAYLAGAWVLAEVSDVVGGRWNLPDRLFQGFFILLAVGFLITLVLAWYHGEKGRQRVSGPELLMVAALLVVAGVALSMVGAPEEPLQLVPPEGDGRPSVAVLPCENWSPDPADANFARGIHDEILLRLSKISGLRSIGRESVEWYRDNPKPMREMALDLGVGFMGECSVRKDVERNQISLTFRLLDGDTGTQLLAENYEEDLTARSLFDIHGDVARRVAGAVGAILTPEELERVETRPTESLPAYIAYSTGRVWLERRGAQGGVALMRAIDSFNEAIAEDSLFAPAHAGLAAAYLLSPPYGEVFPWDVVMERSGEALRVALDVDENLAEAHAALGFMRMQEFRWQECEEELSRAIELNPNYATAHQWYGFFLIHTGRAAEAVTALQTALELEPLSPIINEDLGDASYFARDYETAVDQYLRTLALFPDRAGTHTMLGLAYLQLERYEEARDHLLVGMGSLEGPPVVHPATSITRALTALGDLEGARLVIERSSDWTLRAQIFAYGGVRDLDRTLAAADTAFRIHAGGPLQVARDPLFDFLRDDPRYLELLHDLGLERDGGANRR